MNFDDVLREGRLGRQIVILPSPLGGILRGHLELMALHRAVGGPHRSASGDGFGQVDVGPVDLVERLVVGYRRRLEDVAV